MGAYERNKGHNFERFIAKSLHCMDETARRRLEYHHLDAYGEDIMTSLPVRIQCKCGKQAAKGIVGYKEAYESCPKGIIPVCALRLDRKGDFAIVSWEDFLELLDAYDRGR